MDKKLISDYKLHIHWTAFGKNHQLIHEHDNVNQLNCMAKLNSMSTFQILKKYNNG